MKELLTRLHAHEAPPNEHGRTIQQSRDDVAKKQHGIRPALADVAGEVPLHASRRRIFAVAAPSAEERGFFVNSPGGRHGGVWLARETLRADASPRLRREGTRAGKYSDWTVAGAGGVAASTRSA